MSLRLAEEAVRFAPSNGAAVGRGLGWIRDHEEWRRGGFASWEEYVEKAIGVPLALAEAAIQSFEEWAAAALVADRDARTWLVSTIAAAGLDNLRDAELKAARDVCMTAKAPPPEVWPEIAEACSTLETTFEQDEEEGLPDGEAPEEVF